MNVTPHWRAVLVELERRKEAREDLCDSCDGSGRSTNDTAAQPLACGHCLGQGVLLTAREYSLLTKLGGRPEDDILNSEILQ